MRSSRRWSIPAMCLAIVATTGSASPAGTQNLNRSFDPRLFESGDLIRYRSLHRDDFRAEDPPPEVAGGHNQLGAATCVYLTTHPELAVRASSRGTDARAGQVRASVENLGFMAFMDRSCSWWNPQTGNLPQDYILEHEQIHFALFEIAARRLNRRAPQLDVEWRTVAPSTDDAIDEIKRLIDAEIRSAVGTVMARNNDFDGDTSRTYRPNRQSWWWHQVELELGELAADAEPPTDAAAGLPGSGSDTSR